MANALSLLATMRPALAAVGYKAAPPRRMVLIGRPLGMYAPNIFPEHTCCAEDEAAARRRAEPLGR